LGLILTEGDHHKNYILDLTLKILMGEDAYLAMRDELENMMKESLLDFSK
jgi:hypothetical protein